MSEGIRPSDGDLGLTRWTGTFAALSVLLLGLLAVVPLRADDREWVQIQRRYNDEAMARGLEPIPIEIRQIYLPENGVVDRCTTCHLGMGKAAPLEGSALFGAHPPVPHAPRQMGCTPCHAGKGRATRLPAAHGRVEDWVEPMLLRPHFEAGCGACHSHLPLLAERELDEGQKQFEASHCSACHSVDGTNGTFGPDLSLIGQVGADPRWYDEHAARSRSAKEGPWFDDFEPLLDEEIQRVEAFLGTLVGAPRLMEGKALAHRLGCRGCHRILGVGGDAGPDLSDAGRRLLTQRPYPGLTNGYELPAWLHRHFLDPAGVVPDSEMPRLVMSDADADLLTLYVLSLQDRSIPEALIPRDRARGRHLEERDFPTDGASLYEAFCAGCHGVDGGGRAFGSAIATYPTLRSPDLLSTTDDVTLRRMIELGRPGRRMPPFGTMPGGLRSEEIDAVVSFVRGFEPPVVDYDAARLAPADAARGADLYEGWCSPCHGKEGEGTALGPPLGAPDNPVSRNPSAVFGTLTAGIAETAMGSFRELDAADLAALIGYLRMLPPTPGSREEWSPSLGQGNVVRGATVFADHCSACHGEAAEGGLGPALVNSGFATTATDAFVTATIVRGRSGTDMPGFGVSSEEGEALSPAELADVVAFLRRANGDVRPVPMEESR